MNKFAKRGTFVPSLYQSAIACLLCQQGKNFAARIKAGMGKTMIALLIGALKQKEGINVLVVLVNKLLYEQVRDENEIYCQDSPLEV